MSNPFPGMDPWMERRWSDAHHSIITFARRQIRPLLPPDLKVCVEERLYVASEPPRRQPRTTVTRSPDLSIVERDPGAAVRARSVAAGGGGAVLGDPLVLEMELEGGPFTEGYIEVRERRPSNRLVTVIEVLSPSNKRAGDGRTKYREKQKECLTAGVNLVEIDLLRGGRWTVAAPPDQVPTEGATAAYRASVWAAAAPAEVELYLFPLRERLKAIAVPLRAADPFVPLDLQGLVDGAHDEGEYDDADYTCPPKPKLSPEDMAWARAVLQEKGLINA